MNAATHTALAPLVGLPLQCVGRAANLLWLHFGEMRTVPARTGGTKTVGEWAVHVQCLWRICRSGRIVLGYRDFYYGPDGTPLDDDEWDHPGKSQFDSVATALSAEFETQPPVVEAVTFDDVGGFSLHLAAEYRLDVFPADSRSDCEHWRVFQPGVLGSHFVFRERSELD